MYATTTTMYVRAEGAPWFESVTCDDVTHYFDKVPGRCRCGRETWRPDPPKLRLVE